MFQVVVLPPPGSMGPVEELRRLHDPAFHRVAAHIALLPAFEAATAALNERFDAIAFEPFDASLGPPAAAGSALCLPIAQGSQEMRRLTSTLATSLLGPLGAPPRTAPSMRVGLFGSDAELELARRALATLAPPPPWTVREIVLLLEDVRGLWHEVRRSAGARGS